MFKLNKELSKTTEDIDGDDVFNTKKELNDLGYYKPNEKVGMNKFTDDNLFKSISDFQKDNKLKVDEVMKPGGETERTINKKKEIVSKDKPYTDNVKDWYREVKRVNKLKIDDTNKHQYISCLPMKGDTKMKTTGAVAGLLKESVDMTRKSLSFKERQRHGGLGGIYKDSIKDSRNNYKGAKYGKKPGTNCLDLLYKK